MNVLDRWRPLANTLEIFLDMVNMQIRLHSGLFVYAVGQGQLALQHSNKNMAGSQCVEWAKISIWHYSCLLPSYLTVCMVDYVVLLLLAYYASGVLTRSGMSQ